MKSKLKFAALLSFIFVALAVNPPTAVHAQGGTARAYLTVRPDCTTFDTSGNFTLCFHMYIFGADGSKFEVSSITAVAAPGDTQATILTSITTSAVNAAASAATGYTLARSAVLVPQYVRGQ